MSKVVSTEKVHCPSWGDEGVDAVLVVYEDGQVDVHCGGNCAPCAYR